VPLSQLVLFLAFSAVAGVGLGLLLYYALSRYAYRDPNSLRTIVRAIFARGRRTLSAIEQPKPAAVPPEDIPVPATALVPSAMPVIEANPVRPSAAFRRQDNLASLLDELEYNRKGIKQRTGDSMVALQTDAWSASQRVLSALHPGLMHDLEFVYGDIHLVNHLVWLATEFNRESPALREQYAGLAAKIEARLDQILERLPATARSLPEPGSVVASSRER
jgi:hypothetical protein